MRKLVMIVAAAASLAAAAIVAPTSAEARFDAGLAAGVAGSPVTEGYVQPVQYYGYGYRKPYYAPRYYAPPPVYYAPRYYKPKYYRYY